MRPVLIALALMACDSPGSGGTGQPVDQDAVCLESEAVALERWLCIYPAPPRDDVLVWCDEAFAADPNWVPCLQAFRSVACSTGDPLAADAAFTDALEVCLREAAGP